MKHPKTPLPLHCINPLDSDRKRIKVTAVMFVPESDEGKSTYVIATEEECEVIRDAHPSAHILGLYLFVGQHWQGELESDIALTSSLASLN